MDGSRCTAEQLQLGNTFVSLWFVLMNSHFFAGGQNIMTAADLIVIVALRVYLGSTHTFWCNPFVVYYSLV